MHACGQDATTRKANGQKGSQCHLPWGAWCLPSALGLRGALSVPGPMRTSLLWHDRRSRSSHVSAASCCCTLTARPQYTCSEDPIVLSHRLASQVPTRYHQQQFSQPVGHKGKAETDVHPTAVSGRELAARGLQGRKGDGGRQLGTGACRWPAAKQCRARRRGAADTPLRQAGPYTCKLWGWVGAASKRVQRLHQLCGHTPPAGQEQAGAA